MEWGWSGDDGPPVVINAARPARRPRLGAEWGRRSPRFYQGPNGELLVPAGHHRAASAAGVRPAQIVINNDQINEDWERRPRRNSLVVVDGGVRPRSHSRGSYFEEDYETRKKLERLQELEKKEEEKAHEKRLKEKMLLEKAKEEEEERERKKEEKELKKLAIAEWQEEERRKKEKEKQEEEEADEEWEERTRKMLWRNGYTEDQINRMIKKEKKGKGGGGGGGGGGGEVTETRVIALGNNLRPTYIRVKRKHLDPATLDLYKLPWEWDEDDDDYIIIKKWINDRDQETLFEHTRNLRETKQLTYTTTELRKERDQLLLVKKKHDRKKSPVKSWFLS